MAFKPGGNELGSQLWPALLYKVSVAYTEHVLESLWFKQPHGLCYKEAEHGQLREGPFGERLFKEGL